MTTNWTKIPKASNTNWTKIPKATFPGQVTISSGMPIGLLLALTYSSSSITPGVSIWNKVSKAVNTTWNKITKAT